MTMIFEKIIPTKSQQEKLYLLLLNKKYSISHNKIPSPEEHKKFVLENPYIEWYLLYKDNNLLGSIYFHSDNSIGLNLSQPNKDDILEIITYIKKNHYPLPSIKSLRRGEFFINIPPDDINMIQILKELDKKEIQYSFTI
jgi:hypothetical protein